MTMKALRRNERFITDAKGNLAAVILDIRTYHKLLDELEMREDVEDYRKAKAETQADFDSGNTVSVETYFEKRFGRKKRK
ncbi:MAG: hypothetical protein IAF08_06080 [Rhizobacter sp.]|nr:hypothetical protein [Chlorobiales bacterium]